MTEEISLENELETIKSITFEEIVQYLMSVGSTGMCEACGHSGWSVNVIDEKPIISSLPSFMGTDAILLFVLSCKKCGNLRTPSAKFVAKKVVETIRR